MNIRTMIEAAVSTLDASAQPRMRAAMELGARFAVEAVIKRNGYYNADTKAVLAELDGSTPSEPATVTTTDSASSTIPEPQTETAI